MRIEAQEVKSQLPLRCQASCPSCTLGINGVQERWLSGSEYSQLCKYLQYYGRGPKLASQNPHGSSQLSLTPVPRDLMPSSGLKGYQMHIQIKHLHINRLWHKKSNGGSKYIPIFAIIPALAIRVIGKQLESPIFHVKYFSIFLR